VDVSRPPVRPPWLALLRQPDGRTAGAGFLVDDRHVLTCAYVVNQALDADAASSAPEAEVDLGLPLVSPSPLAGRVVPEGWFPGTGDGGGNVAVLRLADLPPAGAEPAPLRRGSAAVGSRYRVLAFPPGAADGVWTSGTILGPVGPAEWVQLQAGVSGGATLAAVPGGSPVWDDNAGAVVGMLVAHERMQDVDAAYMIPVEVLERYWLPLRTRVLPPVQPRLGEAATAEDADRAAGRVVEAVWRDRIPGYASDEVGLVDRLGITRDVHVLAALLASNKVLPPLSIGLFGEWGSGKSFFMRQLERRTAVLAGAASAAEAAQRESYYCANIVQIGFNAWHYVDANLWASLVARVFEGLDDYLRNQAGSSRNAYSSLLGQLETSRTLLRQALRRRDEARASLRRAEDRRNQRRKTQDQRTVQDVLRSHPEITALADELTDALGLDEARTNLGEIRATVGELRRPGGQLRRSWRTLDGRRGPWSRWRLALVLGAAVVLAGVGLVLLLVGGELILATISLLLSAAGSASAISSALLKNARDALKAAQRVLEAGDPALAAAERTVQEEQERVRRYEEELERLELMEPASLYRFISERYTSTDYRQHLGIVALIQRDFQAMSDLLMNEPGEPGMPSLPRIDRIILYVDDLDRCPPKIVVQVLQAVHLLLAFPLFVVVVGVDSRWLLRSLQREYAAFLAEPDPEAGASAIDAQYWASAPQNYLEKIFQVSYWLRPMEPTGYADLVRTLMQEAAGRPVATSDPEQPDGPDAAAAAGGTPAAAAESRPRAVEVVQTASASLPAVDLTPEALLVSDVEQAFIVAMAPFISTPRAAKRLVNLYRLLRVTVGDDGVAQLQASGEHQAVLVLLAILIGFPAQAEVVLRALKTTRSTRWPEFVESIRPQPWDDPTAREFESGVAGRMTAAEAAPWRRLCAAIDKVGDLVVLTDIRPFSHWAELVGLYSFTTGRFLTTG
jgi:KAP family P-loop domain/Trypsin-like peptidase domain